jgi:hypothetical protein
MSIKVIGSGFIFLASGCGPILTEEQREYIKTVKPDEYYSHQKLLEILFKAEEEQPGLVVATGRRWGSAIKGELTKQGISDPMESIRVLCQIYRDHHQGDIGEITLEEENANTAYITNKSGYPDNMLKGTTQSLVSAQGAEDVNIEDTETENRFKVSWEATEA